MTSNEKILTALEIVHKKIAAGEKFSLDQVTRFMLLSGSIGTAMIDAGIVERIGHTRDVSYKWISGALPSLAMVDEVKETMKARQQALFPKPKTAQRKTIDRLAVSLGHSVTIDPQIALNGADGLRPAGGMLRRALGMDNPPPENIFTSSRISEEKLYLIGQIAGAAYRDYTPSLTDEEVSTVNDYVLRAANDLYNKIYSPLTSQNEQANHQGNG